MGKSNRWIIFDGELKQEDQPVAAAVSRGLMYGEGVFETVRVYQGKTLLLREHLDRLEKGLNTLDFGTSALPGIEEFREQLAILLKNNALLQTDAIIRIQFWQDGGRGYHPKQTGSLHYTILASQCPNYEDSQLTLATVETRSIPSAALPPTGKFTNGINYILAARQAAQQGADDALMQTVDGWISETTIANLFWIKGARVYTPSLECDLLPGITRQALVDIIEAHEELSLHQGKYNLEQLFEAEAAGMCNSVRELLAVHRIDQQEYDMKHPVLNELQDLYSNFRDQNLTALPNLP